LCGLFVTAARTQFHDFFNVLVSSKISFHFCCRIFREWYLLFHLIKVLRLLELFRHACYDLQLLSRNDTGDSGRKVVLQR
jgi:hypothetical protein